jgi:hypothetical protein
MPYCDLIIQMVAVIRDLYTNLQVGPVYLI